MPTTGAKGIVLLVLLCIGISVCTALLVGFLNRTPASEQPAPEPMAPDHRLAALLQRVDALDAALQKLPAVRANEAITPVRVPVAEDHDLADRVAELEKRMAAMTPHRTADAAPASSPRAPKSPLEELLAAEQFGKAERATAQQIICDPRVSISDKLAVQEKVRLLKDAYSAPMVGTLVQIGLNNPDPTVRTRVWGNFDCETHLPEIVPALLRVVTQDAEPLPRQEAAETLGNYLSDPAVRATLEQLVANDPDERVRLKAKRTLTAGRSFRPTAR